MTDLSPNLDEIYDNFLMTSINNGLIWGLVTSQEESAEFLYCESEADPDSSVLVVFSSDIEAKAFATASGAEAYPRAIDLDDFIDQWLPAMAKDQTFVGPDWTRDLEGYEFEPLELAGDLLETD